MEQSQITLTKIQDAYRVIFDLKLEDMRFADFIERESPVYNFSTTNDAWSIKFTSVSDVSTAIEESGLRFRDAPYPRRMSDLCRRQSSTKSSSMSLRIDSQSRQGEQINIYQIICSVLRKPEYGIIAFQNRHFQQSELRHPKFFRLNDLLKAASGNDSVKLCFEISVLPDLYQNRVGDNLSEVMEPSLQLMSMYSFTQNGDLSDITIRTSEQDFKVHKIVLAARSPVFAAMFNNQMQEVQSGIVNVDDVKAEVMGELIRYMYTNAVKDLPKVVYDLFLLAHKYNVVDLEDLCKNYIAKHIEPKNVAKTLELSEKFTLRHVAESVKDFVSLNEAEVVKQNDFVNYLIERLSPENVASNLILADKYNLGNLMNGVKQFIAQNFVSVVRDPEYRELYCTHQDLVLKVDEYISTHLHLQRMS